MTLRRWKRVEYDRLVEMGAFENDRIELVGGYLIVAEPKGSRHTTAVGMIWDALRDALPSGWIVRAEAAVALDEESQPEPDIAVVPGTRADYRDAPPARPVLAIEVAESSLRFDRRRKGSLYARAGVTDYWIVNLIDGVLEIYRDPVPDPAARYGWRYRSVETIAPPSVVTPLAFPRVRIAVGALLP